jgi:hypothetical protein
MAVKTRPQPPLIVIKPEFSFGVLIKALDDPADMSEIDQFHQRQLTQSPGEVIFPILGLIGFADGPLTEKQPAHRGFKQADEVYALTTTGWGYYLVSLQ